MSELQGEGQMTNAEAVSALQEAGRQEAQETAPQPMPVPEQAEQPTPQGQTVEESAAPFETPAESDEVTFDDGQFNPDLLPDELKDGWKQLQKAFTQKTQALSEERKQFESYGEPETVKSALELFQSLQNPEYLQAFHGELTSVLQEMGLSPAEASAEAARQIEEETTPSAAELSPELAALAASDPELAPAAQEIAALRAEMNAMKDAQTQREQALDAQRMEMALSGEIDRQVRTIQDAHPEYEEDDMNAIYERASFYDGNLMKAAELFEADKARIISGWVAQKNVVPAGTQPTPNAGTLSEQEAEPIESIEDGHKAAMAWLGANDAQDLSL